MSTWYPRSKRPSPAPSLRAKLERAVSQMSPTNSFRLSEIDRVLKDEVGEWAAGWCWGNIDGGPVQRWCCVSHSFLKGTPQEEPQRTVDLILAGLEDWEQTLDHCESLFHRLQVKEAIDIDIAVLQIVSYVVEVTDASDAWYSFCHDVLSWYLQHLGIAEERADTYARKAIAGRFESWSAPTEEVRESVAETFRDLVWRVIDR